MPLASSRVSVESAASKSTHSQRETVGTGSRVSRMSMAVKRRASLRSKSRQKATVVAREKENVERRSVSNKGHDGRSPGPTPYWMVARDRDGQKYSPRLTRSATKKKHSAQTPSKEKEKCDLGGQLIFSFSPPDQKANQLREAEFLACKEKARDTRVQFARDNKQLLLFSPNTGRALQNFGNCSEIGKSNRSICQQETGEHSPPIAKLLFGEKDEIKTDSMDERVTNSIFKENVAKDNVINEGGKANEFLMNVTSFMKKEERDAYKNLQEKLDLLLESKGADESTKTVKERLIALETKNENLNHEKKKLEEKLLSFENERKVVQDQIIDMKDQLLDSNVRVESDVAALRKETSSQLEKKNTAIGILEKEKSEILIDRVRLEGEINSLKREAEVRLEGFGASRKEIENEKECLNSRVNDLEHELKEIRVKSLTDIDKKNVVKSYSQVEKEVDRYRNENHFLNDQILKLKESITQLSGNHVSETDPQSQYKEQTTFVQSLKSELHASKNEANRFKNSFDKLLIGREEERLHFQKLNEEGSKNYSRLQNDSVSKDSEISALMKEVELLNTKLTNEQANCKDLQGILFERENNNKKTEEVKRDNSRKVEVMTRELKSEQNLRFAAEKKMKSEIDIMAIAIDSREVQIEKLEHQLDLTNAEKNLIEKQLSDQEKRADVFLNEQENMLMRQAQNSLVIEEQNQRIENSDRKINCLQDEIRKKSSQLNQLEERLELTCSQRDDAKGRLETFDTRENNLCLQLHQNDRIRRELHNKVMQLSGNIRVYVRIRPELPGEKNRDRNQLALRPNTRKRKHSTIEEFLSPFKFPEIFDSQLKNGQDLCKKVVEMVEPPKDRGGLRQRIRRWQFGFDNIFTPSDGQEEVWTATEPLVQSAIDGYNVCIFAYGQTGSGKTYTMLGNESNKGIIFRSVTKLFSAKKETEMFSKGKTTVSLSVELLEIYNETVRDLLAPNGEENHDLKVTTNEVAGNMLVSASSSDEVMEILKLAQSRRCVKATMSNSESSRSHMIFTIHYKVSSSNDQTSVRGKLHICDLAGSERLNKSGANGDGSLLKETQSINSSLCILSNVIEGLQQGNRCIPFRESKLTMILQNSLGGNSKTLAIVCCNPLSSHFHESLCSLRFADKVNRVELKATSNFSC